MRFVRPVMLLAALAVSCAPRAATPQQLLRPTTAVAIPATVVDLVPRADVRVPMAFPTDPPDAVVALGSASVAIPGEVAYFTARFGARDVPSYQPPRPMTFTDAQPIVDAIAAAGVKRDDIALRLRLDGQQPPWQSGRPGWIDITFPLAHPTAENVRAMGKTIADAIGGATSPYHVFSEAVVATASCSAARERADLQAFHNAAIVAGQRAAQRGRVLGAIVAIEALDAGPTQGQCELGERQGGAQVVYRNAEPEHAGLVVVQSSLRVTYALGATRAGTRAP